MPPVLVPNWAENGIGRPSFLTFIIDRQYERGGGGRGQDIHHIPEEAMQQPYTICTQRRIS
jgi:hypothetical protein